MTATLLHLAGLFATLSMLAIGSASTVLPEMQRSAVDIYHWMDNRDFLDLFAIARVAPGPGSMIVALVGERAAGLTGAAVATAAMFGPSCLLIHLTSSLWHRFRESAWRERAERGLAPVAIGMVYASTLVLMRSTETRSGAVAVTLAVGVVLSLTELNPLWLMGAGAAVGWAAGW